MTTWWRWTTFPEFSSISFALRVSLCGLEGKNGVAVSLSSWERYEAWGMCSRIVPQSLHFQHQGCVFTSIIEGFSFFGTPRLSKWTWTMLILLCSILSFWILAWSISCTFHPCMVSRICDPSSRKDDCHKFEGRLDYRVRACLKKERQSREGEANKKIEEFLVWHRNVDRVCCCSLCCLKYYYFHLSSTTLHYNTEYKC